MSKYAVINLKTDPQLKQSAAKVADMLGVSLSAVLNNELRRFTAEKSVVFEVAEAPNTQTASELTVSKKQIEKGNYHKFQTPKEALDFLTDELA